MERVILKCSAKERGFLPSNSQYMCHVNPLSCGVPFGDKGCIHSVKLYRKYVYSPVNKTSKCRYTCPSIYYSSIEHWGFDDQYILMRYDLYRLGSLTNENLPTQTFNHKHTPTHSLTYRYRWVILVASSDTYHSLCQAGNGQHQCGQSADWYLHLHLEGIYVYVPPRNRTMSNPQRSWIDNS